ncbi:MAG TPA: hypothetical protein VN374_07085 [Desulfitobacteriaceae bacterium]|nr:hypothetical protein [Desulfitobacteriaceae bacterium]
MAAVQNTYKENVVAVNTVINSVLSSKLPELKRYPPDWTDFSNAYEKANADALSWVNNVMGRLLEVPDDVRNYNDIITALLKDSSDQAAILVNNPGDKTALAILNNDLSRLTGQLNLVTTFISGAIVSLKNFQDVLPDMAIQLQTIAQKSSADAKADQKQIDQLRSDIKKLQDDISSLTAAIVALGIADASAITLGVIGTIAAWPIGAVIWLFVGPAIAVATTYIALDAIQIDTDKKKIAADQQVMSELTADVSTLYLLSDNYTKLANQSKEIQDNLQAVLNAWLTLETDVTNAVDDIKKAISDTKTPDFKKVQDDLTSATNEWNAAYKQAGDLHLDLNVNNAQVELGMSSDQVKAAMQTGKTMNVMEFYNQVA